MLEEKTRAAIAKQIAGIIGDEHVSIHETDAILNAHDASPLSAAKIRAGEKLLLADIIAFPASAEEVSQVLQICNDKKIPVIPVGGGAGSCGGTVPVYGGVMLDLKRMDRILNVDHESLLITVEAGLVGIDLEEAVTKMGYTIGHTPTSLRASNVGGFLATRSGGSMSSLYGKIEDLTLGLQVVLPNGDIVDCKAVPRHSVGPDLKQLFIGSEGTLGVITEATIRLFPIPEERRFRSMCFPNVHTGLTAIREIFRVGIAPSIVRLYDPLDTAISLGSHFEIDEESCMLMLGFDGNHQQVEMDEVKAVDICLANGAQDFGEGPTKRWWEHRYDMYYPTKFTTAGFSIGDTIDIVATYDKLENVYHAMKEAMEVEGAIVLSHFSHMYQNGGSIYMIFFSSQPDAETAWANYRRIWDAGVDACLKEGGTMSHQHGVGLVRSTYTEDELGSSFQVLKIIKQALDPNGIMNPGKLGLGVRE
ncbi:MAG: FAD-binding oxidoreductase [Candidatus Thorarchaeota archaeon]|nr:FAD-binding oxidoreductase [Candidatus Thorarchaeota archaeon]